MWRAEYQASCLTKFRSSDVQVIWFSNWLVDQEIGNTFHLSGLHLTDPICDYIVSHIHELEHVTELILEKNQISLTGLSTLANAIGDKLNLKLLKLQDLSLTEKGETEEKVRVVSRMINHGMLGLINSNIGDNGLSALAGEVSNGALASLDTLVLQSNAIGDDGMSALASACASGALAQLTHLNLAANRIGDLGIEAFALAISHGAVTSLKSLTLTKNVIGPNGINALADACAKGALTSLEELILSFNEIGDTGLIALAAIPSLKDLRIEQNCIGDKGMIGFAGACTNQNLTHLSLKTNNIGDRGTSTFAEALKGGCFPNLTWLHLMNNQVGDQGMVDFSTALNSSSLERVSFDGNRMTEKGFSVLQQKLKELPVDRNLSIALRPNPEVYKPPFVLRTASLSKAEASG